MDVIPLMQIGYVVECILVDSATENHLLEYLRRSRAEDQTRRSVEGHVGLGGVADGLDCRCKVLIQHFLPVLHVSGPCIEQCLHGADSRGHEILHVCLVSLIHEDDADGHHAHKYQDCRPKENRVYAPAEIIALERPIPVTCPGKHHKDEGEGEEEVGKG